VALRDRFFTAATARAILSWRLAVGAAVGAIAGIVGMPIVGAIVMGIGVYAGLVLIAMPRAARRPRLDPFAISEPWRQYVQGAQRARQRLAATVARAAPGPLRERLDDVVARLDLGLAESWEIARRGDEIDDAVTRLDPTALRSNLSTLQRRAGDAPSDEAAAAMASIEAQLATADRLKQLSTSTSDRLRLTQVRLDELVARTAEVTVGTTDTEALVHDVDDLVVELEGLRLAVEEVGASEAGPGEVR